MTDSDRVFPKILADLHELEFDYAGGDGIDFEPYSEFQSTEDNARWFKAWTGNDALTGSEYRIFGQDGSGGYAAFWLVNKGQALLEQPIVFFGSEGEMGVIASNFGDYLWLLAGGFGPLEAAAYPDTERAPNALFTEFAARHAAASKKTAREVIAAAHAAFPNFEKGIRALCR